MTRTASCTKATSEEAEACAQAKATSEATDAANLAADTAAQTAAASAAQPGCVVLLPRLRLRLLLPRRR